MLVATVALLAAGRAMAQGVTTSAVRGTVTDEQGQPVVGATILLTGTETGARYQAVSQAGGRFFLTNVQVGTYSIEARAIGYRPVREVGLALALGQMADVPLRMQSATVELAPITSNATGATDILAPSRTGAASAVSEQFISNLPSLNRNIIDFIQVVPQVNASSIAGQTNRSNNIQIDGAVNNDLFSLNAADGQPGGRSNARPVSMDAVKEFQVQIAPYDVRYGNFTGGLVNAITRSGTNEWHGTLHGFVRSQELVGRDSLNVKATDFTNNQYGFTLGGPIVRDRLHIYVAASARKDDRPFAIPQIGTDTTGGADSVGIGIRQATGAAVQRIVRDSLGFDPGGFANPTNTNPDKNLLVKLNAQLSPTSQVEASYNAVHASINTLVHSPTATGFRDGYQLGNAGYNFKSDITQLRGRWNAMLSNRFTNELIYSRSAYREPRAINNNVPLILVGGDTSANRVNVTHNNPITNIAVGGERFSQENILNQDITEVTDNLTAAFGRHVFTVGTQNQFFTFYNAFFPASHGVWSFADTNALLAKTPFRYEIALPLVNGAPTCTLPRDPMACPGPNVNWGVKQWGVYAQDVYSPSSKLNLTLGLRVDMPRLDQPVYNHTLDSITAGAAAYVNGACVFATACGGINTSNVPKQVLWSPRFGFSYDANGDRSTYFRGGIGVFTGRPPYVFVSNAYSNTGASQATLICDNAFSGAAAYTDTVPTFSTDVTNQPQRCRTGVAADSQAIVATLVPSVVYMDPSLNFPQNLRLSLGVDHQLPWNIVGTVDLIYSHMLNQFYLNDVNLIPGGTSVGEDNRPLYGTIAANGTNTARRRWTQLADVISNTNSNRDTYWSATLQFQKRFSDNLEFTASYTYSETRDLMSFGSDISNSNMRFSPLDGTLNDRNLTPSRFDVPHKVTLTAVTSLPFGINGSLSYVGRSGLPFTYAVSTDINGDGLSGNDAVYVPLNQQDISLANPAQWTALNNFINSQPCLNQQRGHLMRRNSCRDPWQTFFNARIGKTFHTVNAQSVEISADFFNVLALLGVGGQVKSTSGGFEAVNMLARSGYSTALGRGIYSLALPVLNRVSNFNSRWQMMVGAKYTF